MERIRVLLIEDNPGDAVLVKEMLAEEKRVSFDLDWQESLSAGLKRLAEDKTDVVLLDLMLPDSRGLDTFARTQSQSPAVPIVVMSGLDDEALAISAVRQGAQDYLVKGRVDSRRVALAIRYAIARRLGEERQLTAQELKEYDGKEGKAAYIGFGGKVYDVSNSRLWKSGLHVGKHLAGVDLTEAMGVAPHGEEVFAKFRVAGELTKEKPLAQRLAVKVEEMHLHPIFVHFSIAYSVAVPLLALFYLLRGERFFEMASSYLLLLGFAASPLAGLSGLLSWKMTYEGRPNRVFTRKIVFTVALVVVTVACFLWRVHDPSILMARTHWSYAYLGLAASLLPITAVLGHDGGRIVFSLSKSMWG